MIEGDELCILILVLFGDSSHAERLAIFVVSDKVSASNSRMIGALLLVEYHFEEAYNHLAIDEEADILYIPDIVLELLLVEPNVSVRPYGRTFETGLDRAAHPVTIAVPISELNWKRSRSDERHVTFEYEPEVEQLVERMASDEFSEASCSFGRGKEMAATVGLIGHISELD